MNTPDRVERKALKYLYGNTDRGYLPLMNFSLYAKEKDENYGENLEIFKKLFNSGDKELQMAAWNAMIGLIMANDFAEEDFSDAEAAFLTRFYAAAEWSYSREAANSNRPFSTERLILSPAVKLKELKLYHRHLREDGDFSLYTGRKLSRDNLNLYVLGRPYCFAVYEKKSGQMVGMVGLHSYEEKKNMAQAEWYIFRPYRKRGYAAEAVLALAKRAFSGKLFELRETNWKHLYKKHYAKIDLIRAYIRETNFASQRLAERCKFEEQYTESRHFLIEGCGYEDAKVYELTPEELAEGTPKAETLLTKMIDNSNSTH